MNGALTAFGVKATMVPCQGSATTISFYHNTSATTIFLSFLSIFISQEQNRKTELDSARLSTSGLLKVYIFFPSSFPLTSHFEPDYILFLTSFPGLTVSSESSFLPYTIHTPTMFQSKPKTLTLTLFLTIALALSLSTGVDATSPIPAHRRDHGSLNRLIKKRAPDLFNLDNDGANGAAVGPPGSSGSSSSSATGSSSASGSATTPATSSTSSSSSSSVRYFLASSSHNLMLT